MHVSSIRPVHLKQTDAEHLNIVWSDGHKGVCSTRRLRDHCPCAGCSGETVLLRSYFPPEPDKGTPGRYELKGVEPVGGYALKLQWGDGHDMGLYTWEHLRALCECAACASAEQKDTSQ